MVVALTRALRALRVFGPAVAALWYATIAYPLSLTSYPVSREKRRIAPLDPVQCNI